MPERDREREFPRALGLSRQIGNLIMCWRLVAILALLLSTTFLPAQQYPNIAPSDPKTPEEELKTFKLPPGFTAQLVASEPDIRKPIQIAFDAKGRLWATTSEEYPFPASGRPGKDRLYVMEDFGADGKAKKISIFADDLNIPIGVLPLPDCKSAIVSSIDPGDGKEKLTCWIWKLTDTDGDGKADKKEKLYGPFGCDDTHGMNNSYTLMPDGWVYACHGFKNDSKPKGKDGHEIVMNSGNTFRFRPDGSRIEIWTRGQVNPFGIAVDPYFNLYTADCHSKPITQLIRGATYQSFAKPHDGLGFAPHVTTHGHESTALCGLVYYAADHFPKEYLDHMFLGNVTSNCINMDKIEFEGSTPVATDKGKFLSSSDLWFRPVDIKLGPDGALYFSDFYNKIIGHYEVKLDHPGRDKLRGRMWRIIHRGKDGEGDAPKMPGDFTQSTDQQLIDLTNSNNMSIRLFALNEMVSRGLSKAVSTLAKKQIDLNDPRALRWLVESELEPPFAQDIRLLLEADRKTPNEDTHLHYAYRVALRDAVRMIEDWDKAAGMDEWKAAEIKTLSGIATAVPNAAAAAFLLNHLKELSTDGGRLPINVEHAARYAADPKVVFKFIQTHKPDDFKMTVLMLNAYQQGLLKRGNTAKDPDAIALAEKLCTQAITGTDPASVQAAVDLAGSLKLISTFEPLVKIAQAKDLGDALRTATLAALGAVDSAKALPILVSRLTDAQEAFTVREKAAQVLAGLNRDDANEELVKAFQAVPARVQTAMALALANSARGAEALLKAIETGKASPRLLQEFVLLARLNDRKLPKSAERVAALTKGLPSPDDKMLKLIVSRRDAFAKAAPDVVLGKQIFTKNCAACHQIANEGNKIGPQLDGIGGRGLDRLLEDSLDPNRNVDAAFRTTILNLKDGKTVTGLLLREEGQLLILADDKGKEVRVTKDDVEERRISPLSPMPGNVAEIMAEKEFYDLLAYLLTQRSKQ